MGNIVEIENNGAINYSFYNDRDGAGAGGGGGVSLPEVSSDDNGMVLGVSEGEWGKVAAPTGLPSVSGSDNGKLLGVSSGSWTAVDAPAKGNTTPLITLVTSGFSSSTHVFNFAICKKDGNDDWQAQSLILPDHFGDTLYDLLCGNDNGTFLWPCPLPIPQDDDMVLVFNEDTFSSTYYDVSYSGAISEDTIEFNFGSTGHGHVITGDCTITIVEI